MPFALCIAADLYGSKVNLEIDFPSVPTLSELHSVVQGTFANEVVVMRPPGTALQNFGISKLQIYSEIDGAWRDVLSPAQLSEHAQLYVIQSDPRVQESQQQIMPARRPSRPPLYAATAAPAPAPYSPSMSARNLSPTRKDSIFGANSSVLRVHSIITGAGGSTSNYPAAGSPARTVASPTNPPSAAGRSVTISAMPGPAAAAPLPANGLRSASGSGSGLGLAPRQPLLPVPSESSTQSEKIRFVFDEMDLNGNRVIEIEEFRQVLRNLNVDFAAATVTELFRKGDRDRDGVLSMSEFSNLCGAYSTLLDALFFRLRDVIEARNYQREMADEKAALDAARERRAHAQAMAQEAARLVEQQLKKLNLLDLERTQKQQREREVRSYLAEGEAELEQAKRETHTREVELAQTRSNEESRKLQLQDARQRVQEFEREYSIEVQQLSAAQEKERQLQLMLQEAQQITARCQQQAHAAQAAVSQARDHEQAVFHGVNETLKELQWAQDRLANAEREALLKLERQKELRNLLEEVQMDVTRLLARVEEEQRDTEACRERERHSQVSAADAEAATIAQEQRLLAKDQEIVEFNKRRAAMEQQERPLLEQEVRLKEQRDALEEKEGRLRSDAGVLFDGPRSYRSLSPLRRSGAA